MMSVHGSAQPLQSSVGRLAREFSVKFLYQVEIEQLFYFSQTHCETLGHYFEVPPPALLRSMEICKGYLDSSAEIDKRLQQVAVRWPLSRMAALDRAILRVATFELLEGRVPFGVILNEAIELAKLYGTEKSASFVNGLLDAVAKQISSSQV